MVSRRVIALAAGAGCVALVACQLLADIHDRAGVSGPGASDAGEEGASDAPADVRLCNNAEPPPPSADSSASGGGITILAAIKTIDYTGDAGFTGGAPLGYDLDCVYTCPGPPSCVNKTNKNCDAIDGRDLAGNTLLTTIDAVEATTGAETINGRIASGQLGLILQVSGYNGQANDSNVLLAVILSDGIIVDPDAGTTAPPQWDGTDVWTVDPRTVDGFTRVDGGYVYTPKTLSTSGYVVDGTLVAQIPEFELGLGGGVLTVSDGILSAKIVNSLSPAGFQITGQLVGRASTHALLAATGLFRDPLAPGQYLCGDSGTFQTFRKLLCMSADVMTDPTLDNTGTSCDAVSMAVGFTALPANLGAEYAGISINPGCDGAVDDCTP